MAMERERKSETSAQEVKERFSEGSGAGYRLVKQAVGILAQRSERGERVTIVYWALRGSLLVG